MADDNFERRVRLATLLFEAYVPELPTGRPIPPSDEWPDGFIEFIASTPPIRSLDSQIEDGCRILATETRATWQAWRS